MSDCSIRGPYVDNQKQLIGCLFYLKSKNDNSSGGDFLIYKTIKKIF